MYFEAAFDTQCCNREVSVGRTQSILLCPVFWEPDPKVAGRIRNIGIVVVAMTSVVSMAKRTTLKRMSWYFEKVKGTSSWSFVQHEVSLGGSIIQEIAQGHGSRCDPEFVLHLPRAVLLCSPGIRSAITGSLYPLARFIPCYHLCAPFLYISDCFGCLLWLSSLAGAIDG